MKIILLLVSILIYPVFVTAATIDYVVPVDSDYQQVAVTMQVNGDTCYYVGNSPILSGQALQDFVDVTEDFWTLLILKKMWPTARYPVAQGQSDLDATQAWITAGHTNAAYCTKAQGVTQQECENDGGTWVPEEVITKISFSNMWTPTIVQAKTNMGTNVLYDKTDAQIDTYIDNNVTDIASAKEFLKKLTKQLRNVVRRQGWSNN
jgi:hypothetical protein